ncbi:MAG: ATP-binding cassette domain-containing protein [Puniceicoccaceae bacterium]|nr:MAG: ATP-binding cassette domain-containing protein [Puniceicoccaceae bacterium]
MPSSSPGLESPPPAAAGRQKCCAGHPAQPAEEDNPHHLTVTDLGLKRGDRWLFRHMTWQVPRGKLIAVVGPSGVGKSSLLGCLAGMIPQTEGKVVYCCCHHCLHPPHAFQNRIGIIFQNYMLVPNNSVLNNVLCGRLGRYAWWQTLFGFRRRDRHDAIRILQDLGLGRYLHRWVSETSGGEQQRTAIARALLQEPEIFLADEPVSNLDTYLTGRVLGILRQQALHHRRTILCVLHNPDLVHRFADYVLSLDPMNPEGWHIRQVGRPPSAA